MGSEGWILGLVGIIVVGGLYFYGRSQDEKDPLGYLSDLFTQTIDPKRMLKETKDRRLDFYKESGFRGRSLD